MFGKKDKEEKIKLSKNAYKKARLFLSYMKPYRGTYTIGWVFLILSSVTAMLFPLLMGKLLGNENPTGGNMPSIDLGTLSITGIFLSLIIVFASQSVFSFFRIVLFSIVTEGTLRDIKLKAFDRFIHFPIEFYNKNKVGELTSRIATDINLLQGVLNTTIAEFIRQFITIGFGVTYIVYTSPSLALWMLAIIPIVVLIAIIFGSKVKKLSKRAQDESAKSNSILEEVLTGIVNVKAFTNEAFESSRYGLKVENVKRLSIQSGLIRGAFVSFIMFFMFGAIVFIAWKAKAMVGIEITESEFYSFVFFTIFVGASLGSLPNLYADIQKAIGASEHLMNLIEEDVEPTNQLNSLTDFKGDVTFNDVHFSYPSRKEIEVLKGISFECKSGETTALVGSSGAGKSTISALLLKFYDVDSGKINFDGIDIATVKNESLRSQIAVVPQEVILFGGTIKENIAYGNLDATDEEIMEAAKKANAFDFIEKFPDKMETLVGDRGIQLSGGQKQRVAIARAVLKNPKILILDEATSALDTESEKLVQDALDKLMENRTSFVIAHRLSTIKKANNILVLEKGKIVQSGNHNDLIADNTGVYFKLNNMQLN
ncbi:MAG TPA: ATP-binding cassette domain-containing protein [Crocinitomix sp.]|nr:ATP-binding cassette domain-containing protein [Crocinitomix sp.]